MGHWIFIDSDNAQISHYSVWDKSGSRLIRRGNLSMNQDVLVWYMKNMLNYTVERGLI